jgi:hypothetical protein
MKFNKPIEYSLTFKKMAFKVTIDLDMAALSAQSKRSAKVRITENQKNNHHKLYYQND